MGLTTTSTGRSASDQMLSIQKNAPDDHVIALAGNPNVGKSTVFNALTKLHQHTGNWPGKTVANAQGHHETAQHGFVLVDLPGTYSLLAHSAEEEVARNFLCFDQAEGVIVVCDATCLERNLNLVLQTLELTPNVLLCVNLMDEARRKQIDINTQKLSNLLKIPVISISAREKSDLKKLDAGLDSLIAEPSTSTYKISYPPPVQRAINQLIPLLEGQSLGDIQPRWLALRLLEGDPALLRDIDLFLGRSILDDEKICVALEEAHEILLAGGLDGDALTDAIVSAIVQQGEDIAKQVVTARSSGYSPLDRRLDRLLTSRLTGYPILLAMLTLIFWLTIAGANVPSALLADGLFWVEDRLSELFLSLGSPLWLHDVLVLGVYRVVAWVVSVMLPPMAIFFPLFTLLEDGGYLPRVAYLLDKPFQRCSACGKQALTMAMGLGCNAAGIIGCRIIDSPRERLLAILTNNFMPCNGRFPTLIAILTIFFVGTSGGFSSGILSALLLTGVILLGVLMTFFVTKALSMTLLKGMPSSFALELPPYRPPQIGQVIVRSIFDRTLFVLGRAIVVAAPAGLIIWGMANLYWGELSILKHCAQLLDPFANLLGLDGVILLAFLLGMPANEIVVPIMIMAYLSQGSLLELESLAEMRTLLIDNGWTWVTAISTCLFSLMHWPCSTTLLTIKKETGSIKWTALAFLLPTGLGLLTCFLFASISRYFL